MTLPTELTGTPGDAAAIIEAARETADPATLIGEDGPQAFVIPKDATLEIPDLSAWRAYPYRKRGLYWPGTVQSLIDYVGKHADTDSTTIWIDQDDAVIAAVLNDHAPTEAHWGDHRAILDLKPSPEWLYWTKNDQKLLSQEEFVEHLEAGIDDILEPTGAELLELAQSFHATSGATFRSSIRLASGEQQLQYDETIAATAGARGEVTVPTRFMLGISPFVGEDPYKIVARLRFRVTGGTLRLGYYLDRPDRVRRDALEQIADRIAETFANVYAGVPSAPPSYR